MTKQNNRVFQRLYKSARKPEDLPWHAAEPPDLLVSALNRRASPGNALDIGCGSGTYSIYMAERGYQVTALDFMPQAIAMLQDRLTGHDLAVEAIQTDINKWVATKQFDVVLDVGCLHTRRSIIDFAVYKAQLLSWLTPGGDFVLVHFARRGWWDWWPIGPSRVYTDILRRRFAPELELIENVSEVRHGFPIFLGRSALIARYWFRRT